MGKIDGNSLKINNTVCAPLCIVELNWSLFSAEVINMKSCIVTSFETIFQECKNKNKESRNKR